MLALCTRIDDVRDGWRRMRSAEERVVDPTGGLRRPVMRFPLLTFLGAGRVCRDRLRERDELEVHTILQHLLTQAVNDPRRKQSNARHIQRVHSR